MTPCFFPFWEVTVGGEHFSLSKLVVIAVIQVLSSSSPEQEPINEFSSPFWIAKINFFFFLLSGQGERGF